jgi:hypothetical protein
LDNIHTIMRTFNNTTHIPICTVKAKMLAFCSNLGGLFVFKFYSDVRFCVCLYFEVSA